ncbi:MAG: hypothetical protein ACRDSL_03240 [Pseudonocardiaceae bacterium]
MSHRTPDMFGPRVAAGREVPRPQLAGALASALRTTNVVERAVAAVGTALVTDLSICDQLVQLSTVWRVALRRAESQARDKLGVGLSPGAARRLDLDCGGSIVIVHGDGWSLVARTPAVLLVLLDVAPGLVIDRSRAEGAAELVSGLADRLS